MVREEKKIDGEEQAGRRVELVGFAVVYWDIIIVASARRGRWVAARGQARAGQRRARSRADTLGALAGTGAGGVEDGDGAG